MKTILRMTRRTFGFFVGTFTALACFLLWVTLLDHPSWHQPETGRALDLNGVRPFSPAAQRILSRSDALGRMYQFAGVQTGTGEALTVGCDTSAKVQVTATMTGAVSVLATPSPSNGRVYVCTYSLFASAPATVKLDSRSSTTCGGTPNDLTGSYNLGSSTGITVVSPIWNGLATNGGETLCLVATGTGSPGINGFITYTTF